MGHFSSAVDTSKKTKGALIQPATATIRAALEYLMFGFSGTPADNAFLVELQRTSGAGAGTSSDGNESAMIDGAPTPLIQCKQAYSAEPTTYDAGALLPIPVNQRATFQYYVPVHRPIFIPKTNNAALGLRTLHAGYTGNIEGVMQWHE
jgi:hypothetical protein